MAKAKAKTKKPVKKRAKRITARKRADRTRIRGKADTSTPSGDDPGWNIFGTQSEWMTAESVFTTMTASEREQAYKKLGIVYSCVRSIATSIVEAPLEIGSDDPESGEFVALPDHPALDLVYNPNHFMSYSEFLESWVQRLLLNGKSFIWKLRGNGGQIARMWPWPSSLTKVILAEKGTEMIEGYKLKQSKGREKMVLPKDMFYVRFPDPENLWDGVSPLQAATRDYQTEIERGNYIAEMLTNLKVPVITVSGPEGSSMGPDQEARVRQAIDNKIGRGKRGNTLVLGGGMTAQVNAPLADLDWPSLSNLTESRICSAFGVPPMIVGVRVGLENSPWSNMKEARKTFYTETVKPTWTSCADVLTRGVLRNEGEQRLYFKFNLDNVSELQEDQNEKSTRVTVAFNGGVITRNEARMEMGFEEVDEPAMGDVYRVPINVTEIPAEGEPEPAGEPGEPAPIEPEQEPDMSVDVEEGKRVMQKYYDELETKFSEVVPIGKDGWKNLEIIKEVWEEAKRLGIEKNLILVSKGGNGKGKKRQPDSVKQGNS